ncbi:MAG: hypothetical protein IMY86_00900 [Chloroflexi bacterium]|nr:hypothetical protein [Chloroflexota bacterium]
MGAPIPTTGRIAGNGAGKYTFYVIAVDAAGNSTTSDPVTIRLVPHEREGGE